MYEDIICYNIEVERDKFIDKKVTVNVYLKDGDNIMNDYRSIKRELENTLCHSVYNFMYKYKN